MMDREICTICNNPVWLCHSTDNRIDFEVETRACYAKAELEDYQKSARGKNLGSGEYLVARAVGIEGMGGEREALPPRHEAYKRLA